MQLSEEQLARKVGLYWNRERDGFRKIFMKEGKLHLTFPGEDESYEMKPLSENRFRAADSGRVLENKRGGTGFLLVNRRSTCRPSCGRCTIFWRRTGISWPGAMVTITYLPGSTARRLSDTETHAPAWLSSISRSERISYSLATGSMMRCPALAPSCGCPSPRMCGNGS